MENDPVLRRARNEAGAQAQEELNRRLANISDTNAVSGLSANAPGENVRAPQP